MPIERFITAKKRAYRDYLMRLMEEAEGSVTVAARLSGINRTRLYKTLARYAPAARRRNSNRPVDMAKFRESMRAAGARRSERMCFREGNAAWRELG